MYTQLSPDYPLSSLVLRCLARIRGYIRDTIQSTRCQTSSHQMVCSQPRLQKDRRLVREKTTGSWDHYRKAMVLPAICLPCSQLDTSRLRHCCTVSSKQISKWEGSSAQFSGVTNRWPGRSESTCLYASMLCIQVLTALWCGTGWITGVLSWLAYCTLRSLKFRAEVSKISK